MRKSLVLSVVAALAAGAASLAQAGGAPSVTTISSSTGGARGPAVGIDGSGAALAAWTWIGDAHLSQYALANPQQIWASAATAPGSGGSTSEDHVVAVASNGDAVVAWTDLDGSSTGQVRAFLRRGGVATPVQVLTPAWNSSDTVEHVRVAVSSSGRAVVVWGHWDSQADHYEVQAAIAEPGGKFGAAQTISAGDGAYVPSVGIDASGNAVALWAAATGNPYDSIESARAPAGSGFGAVQVVDSQLTGASGATQDPALAVSSNGELVGAWVDVCQSCGYVQDIAAATGTTTSGFGSSSPLSNGNTENADEPVAAIDASGNSVVAWEDGGAALMAALDSSGGSFGTPEQVAGLDDGYDHAFVAQMSAGKAYVAYINGAWSASPKRRIYLAQGDANGFQTEAISPSAVDSDQPALAVDAAGKYALAWREDNGSTTLIGAVGTHRVRTRIALSEHNLLSPVVKGILEPGAPSERVTVTATPARGSERPVTVTTDQNGAFTASFARPQAHGRCTFTAKFAGDVYYGPSSATIRAYC